jgi:2-keto-4-pentenoate hydratase/2-oxohepta-3-ene-1,7-dioic acid hydratase in catechol pathway
VIGTGTNYFSHVEEMGSSPPAVPTANFFKLTGAVCTSGTPIVIPQGSFVDYEGEIAVVIGEPLSDVSADEVGEADISLCLANDVTAREVPTTHLSLAKSAAGFCPLGPARVPIRELRPSEIEFVVEVNGEPRQQGRADDMIFSIPELVASLSRAIDLRPGDVILTGSPAGVGAALTPQRFLDAGDVVRVTSPQLGVLENRFVAAAPSRMNS